MKLLLAFTLFIGLIITHPQENCRCVPATDDDTTRWGGNADLVVKEDKTYRRLFGTVKYRNDELVTNSLVEVYTHPEYLLLKYPEREEKKKKQRRIAACVTREDGKFCFGFIKAGKYELRISQGSGVNVTHIYVEVNPYDNEGTEAEISAVLTPGT